MHSLPRPRGKERIDDLSPSIVHVRAFAVIFYSAYFATAV